GTRHQVNGRVPLTGADGVVRSTSNNCGLNEPPRLRPRRRLRRFFLMGAATPPLPRSIQSCPADQLHDRKEVGGTKTKNLSAYFLERGLGFSPPFGNNEMRIPTQDARALALRNRLIQCTILPRSDCPFNGSDILTLVIPWAWINISAPKLFTPPYPRITEQERSEDR